MSKNPIRILNLFTIMDRGGAETMVMNYYRNIDRTKIQFDFMVHRAERGAYDDEIEALGGKIYRMCPIYPKNFGTYKQMLEEFFEAHKEYRIIHSHMSELGYFAFKEAKKQGVPVRICHAHNAPHGWDMKMFVRYYFKRNMMPYITHMFMCGKESGDWLFGKQNQKQFIQMNNAIDANQFRYDEKIENEVRKELGIENKYILGHVGRFNKQKNHEFLIQVYKEFYKINPESVLILVGAGELKEHIVELVQEQGLDNNVLFLGSRKDVNRIMQCFDVFVFPSLFEGFPVTMVEAQAASIKCCISDKMPDECVFSDNVQIITLKNNPKEWARKIYDIHKYEKKDMYQTIIEKHFDIKDNAKWLEEFYLNECK